MAQEQGISPEERRKRYRDNQNYFSSKLSELARYVGFGLAALAYTLLSSSSAFAVAVTQISGNLLLIVGLMGVLTVLSDYLHLLCGWFANSQAAGNKKNGYQLEGWGNFFRFFQDYVFFYAKQILPLAGAGVLIFALWPLVELGQVEPVMHVNGQSG